MDPNKTLERLRAAIVLHDKVRDGNATYDTHEGDILDDVLELVQTMDNWLTTGGFLPSAWAGTRSDPTATGKLAARHLKRPGLQLHQACPVCGGIGRHYYDHD